MNLIPMISVLWIWFRWNW